MSRLDQINLIKSVEQQVNREELDSIFLLDRLHNSEIRKQIVDLLEAEELSQKGKYYDYVIVDEKGQIKTNKQGEILTEKREYIPVTREHIEATYDKCLEEISSETPVVFSDKQPTKDSVSVNWRDPQTGKELSPHQKSIVEAHEKGHIIRPYDGKYVRTLFNEAFDRKAIDYTIQDYWREVPLKERKNTGFEEWRNEFFDYLFSANELAERMSQLKNYFSMRANEPFTKEHLDYARENYIKDTGMDNRMKFFFQSITPEKEEAFIKLINSAGI